MPYPSRQSIESIAQHIVAAYKKLPSLEGQHLNMIQPELLTQDLLGLTIQLPHTFKNSSILGLTAHGEVEVPVYDDLKQPSYVHLDGRTLLIDRGLIQEGANRGRYHFTLIHEVCPYKLNSTNP